MVKIHFSFKHKKYKNSVYEYEAVSLNFPKELHDFLRCLRERQLEIKASRQGKTTHILLKERD